MIADVLTGLRDHSLVLGNCRTAFKDVPNKTVQAAICSPPYWGQRSYGSTGEVWGGDPNCLHDFEECGEDGRCPECGAWYGELGNEPTPEMFIANLIACFEPIHRILRDDGTLWVNLGFSFAGSGKGMLADGIYDQKRRKTQGMQFRRPEIPVTYKRKDLIGIPFDFANAMREAGWYFRFWAPWIKKNGMPESHQDRFGMSTEVWLMFAKGEHYYFDYRAALMPLAEASLTDGRPGRGKRGTKGVYKAIGGNCGFDPSGRRRRDTDFWFESLAETIAELRHYLQHLEWVQKGGGLLFDPNGEPLAFNVNTKGFTGEHVAPYPERLIAPIIAASTSNYACDQCRAPWERTEDGHFWRPTCDHYDLRYITEHPLPRRKRKSAQRTAWGNTPGGWFERVRRRPCRHGWPSKKSIVVDPFVGSGTTLAEAVRQGRAGIGADVNPHYLAVAEKRITKGGAPLVAALVPEPLITPFMFGG